MDPRSEEVDYEAYLNSFYAEGGQSPQVPERAVDTTDTNVVPSLPPVPKPPKVEKPGSASPLFEWTFNDPDSEYNVLRDEDGSLKASTVPKVIAKLTLDADPTFTKQFLLTYRCYNVNGKAFDGPELLAALKARYATCDSLGEVESRIVRGRVFNVLKHWIEYFWHDFEQDCPALSNLCFEWLDQLTSEGVITAQNLRAKIQNALDPLRALNMSVSRASLQVTNTPRPYHPEDLNISVFACHPEEVARQICMVEWKYWKAILPSEFLNLAWTKKDKATRAPGILGSIEHFNRMSAWVATTILKCEDFRLRVKIFKHWVLVADHLKNLGNFNGMMEVVAGMNSAPVYRLKHTIECFRAKNPKIFPLYEKILEETSPLKSYAILRGMIKSVTPPCIPYLGMYLTDLTFIEEGNPTYVTEHKLVNLQKTKLMSQSIADIQTYQAVGYSFHPLPLIAAQFCVGAERCSETHYEWSNKLEPRGAPPPVYKKKQSTIFASRKTEGAGEPEKSKDTTETEEEVDFLDFLSSGPPSGTPQTKNKKDTKKKLKGRERSATEIARAPEEEESEELDFLSMLASGPPPTAAQSKKLAKKERKVRERRDTEPIPKDDSEELDFLSMLASGPPPKQKPKKEKRRMTLTNRSSSSDDLDASHHMDSPLSPGRPHQKFKGLSKKGSSFSIGSSGSTAEKKEDMVGFLDFLSSTEPPTEDKKEREKRRKKEEKERKRREKMGQQQEEESSEEMDFMSMLAAGPPSAQKKPVAKKEKPSKPKKEESSEEMDFMSMLAAGPPPKQESSGNLLRKKDKKKKKDDEVDFFAMLLAGPGGGDDGTRSKGKKIKVLGGRTARGDREKTDAAKPGGDPFSEYLNKMDMLCSEDASEYLNKMDLLYSEDAMDYLNKMDMLGSDEMSDAKLPMMIGNEVKTTDSDGNNKAGSVGKESGLPRSPSTPQHMRVKKTLQQSDTCSEGDVATTFEDVEPTGAENSDGNTSHVEYSATHQFQPQQRNYGQSSRARGGYHGPQGGHGQHFGDHSDQYEDEAHVAAGHGTGVKSSVTIPGRGPGPEYDQFAQHEQAGSPPVARGSRGTGIGVGSGIGLSADGQVPAKPRGGRFAAAVASAAIGTTPLADSPTQEGSLRPQGNVVQPRPVIARPVGVGLSGGSPPLQNNNSPGPRAGVGATGSPLTNNNNNSNTQQHSPDSPYRQGSGQGVGSKPAWQVDRQQQQQQKQQQQRQETGNEFVFNPRPLHDLDTSPATTASPPKSPTSTASRQPTSPKGATTTHANNDDDSSSGEMDLMSMLAAGPPPKDGPKSPKSAPPLRNKPEDDTMDLLSFLAEGPPEKVKESKKVLSMKRFASSESIKKKDREAKRHTTDGNPSPDSQKTKQPQKGSSIRFAFSGPNSKTKKGKDNNNKEEEAVGEIDLLSMLTS